MYLTGHGSKEPDATEGDPAETLDALGRRLTVPEVARILGLRQGTVKSRLNRALRNLRRQLDEDDTNSSNASSDKGG